MAGKLDRLRSSLLFHSFNRLTLATGAGTKSKKLLIVNLGGLLIHRVHPCRDIGLPRSQHADAVFRGQYVFKRPFCDEFLRFCLDRFELAIWSAEMKRNTKSVICRAMGSLQDKLLFIWDQEECTDSGFQTLERKDKPLFLKELKKVWEGKYKERFSPSNTLLVDDAPYVALLNPPNTAISPRPYKVDDIDDDILGPAGEFRLFLEGLADAEEDVDVPSYVGAHPVGQGAITSAHPDWDFYSKIIHRFDEAAAGSPRNSLAGLFARGKTRIFKVRKTRIIK